jgi:hypothetical protein
MSLLQPIYLQNWADKSVVEFNNNIYTSRLLVHVSIADFSGSVDSLPEKNVENQGSSSD